MRDGNYIKSTFLYDEYINRIPMEQRIIYESLILSESKNYCGFIQITDRQIRDLINRDDCLEYMEAIMDGTEGEIEKPKDYKIINTNKVKKYLDNLINDGKILRMPTGYLLINHIKHQNYATNNCTGLLNAFLSMNAEELEIINAVPKIIDSAVSVINKAIQEYQDKWTKKETSQAKSFVNSVRNFIDVFFQGKSPSFVIEKFIKENETKQGGYKGVTYPDKTTIEQGTNPRPRPTHNSNSNININTKSNNNINTNYNCNDSENYNYINKKKEKNIESSKNPSLEGQVFVDSSAEAKISARAKKKKKEEETREERKARKQKERRDACDLALTLMKTYKGVELRRKLKKVLQPYEPEEYDQVMETPRARYWNIPAKQYYFSERSIPDAQIEQAERVVEKVNEYVMDNFDADEQIPALNPFIPETAYKILNDYFQGSEDAFLEELFSHFDKLKEEGRLHKIRNLDLAIYSFGTNVPIDDLMNKDLL